MKKRYWILIPLLAIIVLLGGVYVYFEIQRVSEIHQLTKNVQDSKQASEKAAADVVKAELNLYYVLYGAYPIDKEVLIEGLLKNPERSKEENKKDIAGMESSIKELKDFQYNVRGNRKEYKFTYINQKGETVEEEGNYEKDFH